MSVLSILATTFGILMGLANFPQAYRIFKRKHAKDVSILTFSIIAVGGIVWLAYGIEINNIAIILGNGVGVIACTAVIIGWIKYH
ncbi:MAG: SemiSWEET family transporter [Candidatus Woesearchaeota archaeon]